MRRRLETARDLALVGTGLMIAGAAVLGLAHLRVLGWPLLGLGIVLLALALLWIFLDWMGWLVITPLKVPAKILRSLVAAWKDVSHWSPLYWAGSPIRWRGLPGSRDVWAPAFTTGVTCASYFTKNVNVDVTDIIRGLVDSSGRLNFTVSNAVLGGDPEYGVVKQFCLDYSLNGETQTATFQEGDAVDVYVGQG